jgi:hypothetical protein
MRLRRTGSAAQFSQRSQFGETRCWVSVAGLVRSPLMAARATLALKPGVWFRRGRLLIVSPDSLGTACPLSGRNSTYRLVQILEAGSNIDITPSSEFGGLHFKRALPATCGTIVRMDLKTSNGARTFNFK